MKQDGTGYLQEGFRASCPNGCGIGHITKEKLGVRRFADDLSDPLAVIACVTLPTVLAAMQFMLTSYQTYFYPS